MFPVDDVIADAVGQRQVVVVLVDREARDVSNVREVLRVQGDVRVVVHEVFEVEHAVEDRRLGSVRVAVDEVAGDAGVVVEVGRFLIRHRRELGDAVVAVPARVHAEHGVRGLDAVVARFVVLVKERVHGLHAVVFARVGLIGDVDVEVVDVGHHDLREHAEEHEVCDGPDAHRLVVDEGQEDHIKGDEREVHEDRGVPEVLDFQFVRDEDEPTGQKADRQEVSGRELTELRDGAEREDQQEEDVHEGLAVRQVVREVEAVPDVVEIVDVEGDGEEGDEHDRRDLFLQGDGLYVEIQDDQHDRPDAAEDVRQDHVSAGADGGLEVAEMVRQEVEEAEVALIVFRERAGGGGAGLECVVGGQQREGGQQSGDARVEDAGEEGDGEPVRPDALQNRGLAVLRNGEFPGGVGERMVAEVVDEEVQDQEDGGHVSHVVGGHEEQGEGEAVEKRFALFHDVLDPEHDEGQQHHAVHPHDVPVVGDEVAGEGVQEAEARGDGVVLPELGRLLEVVGEEGGGESGLQHDDDADGHGHVLVAEEQDDQDGDGARQVVEQVAEEVATAAGLPGIGETAAVGDAVIELREERPVLVVEVHAQDGHIAKGDHAVGDADEDEHDDGPAKGQQDVAVFPEQLLQPVRFLLRRCALCGLCHRFCVDFHVHKGSSPDIQGC